MTTSDAIDEALSFDPLLEAEKITGFSYKYDRATSFLGMLLSAENSRRKDEVLKNNKDTCQGNTLGQNLWVIEDLGFNLMASGTFTSTSLGNVLEEKWFMYWREGILIFIDTFQGKLNSGKAYFNYLQKDKAEYPKGLSGGFIDGGENERIAYGYIDIREGLRHHLFTMERNGKFLDKWVKRPFLWLLHHGDTKNPEYNRGDIVKERLAMLPYSIQDAIPGEGD